MSKWERGTDRVTVEKCTHGPIYLAKAILLFLCRIRSPFPYLRVILIMSKWERGTDRVTVEIPTVFSFIDICIVFEALLFYLRTILIMFHPKHLKTLAIITFRDSSIKLRSKKYNKSHFLYF
jgi:hypothetical protein